MNKNEQQEDYINVDDEGREFDIVKALSAPLIGVGIVFLASLVLSPHQSLDEPLQIALVSFSVSIPLLIATYMLAVMMIYRRIAIYSLILGFAITSGGLVSIIRHVDLFASWVFTFAAVICSIGTILLAIMDTRKLK